MTIRRFKRSRPLQFRSGSRNYIGDIKLWIYSLVNVIKADFIICITRLAIKLNVKLNRWKISWSSYSSSNLKLYIRYKTCGPCPLFVSPIQFQKSQVVMQYSTIIVDQWMASSFIQSVLSVARTGIVKGPRQLTSTKYCQLPIDTVSWLFLRRMQTH